MLRRDEELAQKLQEELNAEAMPGAFASGAIRASTGQKNSLL